MKRAMSGVESTWITKRWWVPARLHVIGSGRCLFQSRTPRRHPAITFLVARICWLPQIAAVTRLGFGGTVQIEHGLHWIGSTCSKPLRIDTTLRNSNPTSSAVLITRLSRYLSKVDAMRRLNYTKAHPSKLRLSPASFGEKLSQCAFACLRTQLIKA